jgi:hypothetical protein
VSSNREECDRGLEAQHNTNEVEGNHNTFGRSNTVANANVPIHVHVYAAQQAPGRQAPPDSFTPAERELIHIVRGLEIDGQLQIYKAAKAASVKRSRRMR